MKLDKLERESALWRKLDAEINSRLEVLRRRNDGDLDLVETTRIRGQVLALKGLLALADEPTPVTVTDDRFD